MSEIPRHHVSVQEIAPTAEKGWWFRRAFAFGLAAAFVVLFRDLIFRTTDPQVLRFEALLLAGLLALVIAFYMGGATLTDIWRLITAVRTTRAITETRGRQ